MLEETADGENRFQAANTVLVSSTVSRRRYRPKASVDTTISTIFVLEVEAYPIGLRLLNSPSRVIIAHCSFAHNFTGSAGSVSQGFVELPRTKQHVLQPFTNSLGINGLLAHGGVRC